MTIMRSFLPLALISTFAASPALADGPSFDCRKARGADEIAICRDAQLSQLDRLAALAFDATQHVSGRVRSRDAAREGLAARRACGSNKACILAAQVGTIARLQ